MTSECTDARERDPLLNPSARYRNNLSNRMESFDRMKTEDSMDDDLAGFIPLKHGSSYVCPWSKFKRPGLWNLLKWKLCERDRSNIPNEQARDRILPIRKVDKAAIQNPPKDKVQVTWIGHATLLAQFDGITILSDPLFRDFCGPEIARFIPCFGYWRLRKAACQAVDIPEDKLDAVIISHDHYDHLDLGSVRQIHARFPNVTWFVAEGTASWLRSNIDANMKVQELSWWNEAELNVGGEKFRFISTPSQHWCQRGIFDFNKCLWCSWVIKGPRHSYFFGGDTGYHQPLFQKIQQRYGPFSLAAVPIGAYTPRYITQWQHVDPGEAVDIHQDLDPEKSVSIHWGTFQLTNEFYLDPPRKVDSILKQRGQDASKFVSLCHGETWVLGEARETSPFMVDKGDEKKEQDKLIE